MIKIINFFPKRYAVSVFFKLYLSQDCQQPLSLSQLKPNLTLRQRRDSFEEKGSSSTASNKDRPIVQPGQTVQAVFALQTEDSLGRSDKAAQASTTETIVDQLERATSRCSLEPAESVTAAPSPLPPEARGPSASCSSSPPLRPSQRLEGEEVVGSSSEPEVEEADTIRKGTSLAAGSQAEKEVQVYPTVNHVDLENVSEEEDENILNSELAASYENISEEDGSNSVISFNWKGGELSPNYEDISDVDSIAAASSSLPSPRGSSSLPSPMGSSSLPSPRRSSSLPSPIGSSSLPSPKGSSSLPSSKGPSSQPSPSGSMSPSEQRRSRIASFDSALRTCLSAVAAEQMDNNAQLVTVADSREEDDFSNSIEVDESNEGPSMQMEEEDDKNDMDMEDGEVLSDSEPTSVSLDKQHKIKIIERGSSKRDIDNGDSCSPPAAANLWELPHGAPPFKETNEAVVANSSGWSSKLADLDGNSRLQQRCVSIHAKLEYLASVGGSLNAAMLNPLYGRDRWSRAVLRKEIDRLGQMVNQLLGRPASPQVRLFLTQERLSRRFWLLKSSNFQ